MKKLRWLLGSAMITAGLIMAGRTARLSRSDVDPAPTVRAAIPAGAAERLAQAVRIPTISSDVSDSSTVRAFAALHKHLEISFPRVHATLTRETVGTSSLLYTWQGEEPRLDPILLSGHLDVVPVEPGTEALWEQNPFGGMVDDQFIWGRGTIDNKSTVVGTLEAVEMLLAEGFTPARTVMLAYGHDEEVGGVSGAREIASLLQARQVQLGSVLDEGGVISEGILPGISGPVALVGIAEKGFVSIELSVRVSGGHSSLPPARTAIGLLSTAVAKLEERQMPARLTRPTEQLFESIAPRLPLVQRVGLANLWLTRPLVLRQLRQRPSTNAMIRTTTAPTTFHAGTKDNVLPGVATATVNFRILPGDSVAGVLDHVRRVVGDSRLEIRIAGRFSAEPSAVAPADSDAFRTLERTIREVSPDVTVAPFLVVVATDARHYAGLTPNVFRFLPLRLTGTDLERMHGTNERISIANYHEAIQVYRHLLVGGTR